MSNIKLDIAVTIPQHMKLNAFASPETCMNFVQKYYCCVVALHWMLYFSPFLVESLDNADICYSLFAMSNHLGTQMGGGHYTADVKHFASEQWFNCNDQT